MFKSIQKTAIAIFGFVSGIFGGALISVMVLGVLLGDFSTRTGNLTENDRKGFDYAMKATTDPRFWIFPPILGVISGWGLVSLYDDMEKLRERSKT